MFLPSTKSSVKVLYVIWTTSYGVNIYSLYSLYTAYRILMSENARESQFPPPADRKIVKINEAIK